MEENKSCYNCKYFVQHYILSKHNIRELYCGHCTERRISAKELKIFPFENGCDIWEIKEPAIEERKNILCNDLKRMAKELHIIYLMLKNYNQDENQ